MTLRNNTQEAQSDILHLIVIMKQADMAPNNSGRGLATSKVPTKVSHPNLAASAYKLDPKATLCTY